MDTGILQHLTLDVLQSMYNPFAGNIYDPSFLHQLTTRNIYSHVALRLFRDGLWTPREPLREENTQYAGDLFPKEDKSTIRNIIWRFVGLGILTPRQMIDEDNQLFELSIYGAQVLATGEESPYDPYGFLKNLHDNSPALESNSYQFIEESVYCFLSRHFRASMVMLGLSSENEILATIELYQSKLNPEKKVNFIRKLSSCKSLKAQFDLLYQQLYEIRMDLPSDIRELDTWLNGIFQVIRMSRNDAGHPIGINPTNEDVFSNLCLLRTYARNLSKLKDHLK